MTISSPYKKLKFSFLSLVPIGAWFVFFKNENFLFWEHVGMIFSIFIFVILIKRLGRGIPIEELTVFLFSIQMIISPIIVYHYFDNMAMFEMFLEPVDYFKVATPAVIIFYLGFHGFKLKWKVLEISDINEDDNLSKKGKFWIIVAFSSQGFDALLPPSFDFIFYLLENCKFIGLIYLIYSRKKADFIWMAMVFLLFFADIVRGGMFYDLFAIAGLIFIYYAHEKKYKVLRNLVIMCTALISVLILQSIKNDYREIIWRSNVGDKSRIEIFTDLVVNKSFKDGAIFSDITFDLTVSRLNQGWILSKVLDYVPRYEDFSNGQELMSDIGSILIPRFLFPNKKAVGGKDNQEKFAKYTGQELIGGTTMRLGFIADSYINFGVYGGFMLIFLTGLLLRFVINSVYKNSIKYPFLVFWLPFLFNYVIRLSDYIELLNYLVKGVLVFVFFIYIEKRFIKTDSTSIENVETGNAA